jgi:DnaJ-class molecular chaperone
VTVAAQGRFEGDYYARLELDPGATEVEIRRAYRRLALQWHPDRNPDTPEAGERFKAISEAYAVLIDPAKRRAYDRARLGGAGAGFRASREDLFRDLFTDPRASIIFEELAREFARMGLSVDRRDFQQTLFGGRAVVSGRVVVITPFTPLRLLVRLAGAAWRGAAAAERSRRPVGAPPRGILGGLGRAGRWLLGAERGEDIVVPLPLTPAEAERGGKKRVALESVAGGDEVLVTIPPRVRAGTRLRLRGKGRPAAHRGRGDAYLVVEIAGPERRQ